MLILIITPLILNTTFRVSKKKTTKELVLSQRLRRLQVSKNHGNLRKSESL